MTEQQIVSAYFTYCKLQKNLDNKTLKAYQIDLKQFVAFYPKPTTVKFYPAASKKYGTAVFCYAFYVWLLNKCGRI